MSEEAHASVWGDRWDAVRKLIGPKGSTMGELKMQAARSKQPTKAVEETLYWADMRGLVERFDRWDGKRAWRLPPETHLEVVAPSPVILEEKPQEVPAVPSNESNACRYQRGGEDSRHLVHVGAAHGRPHQGRTGASWRPRARVPTRRRRSPRRGKARQPASTRRCRAPQGQHPTTPRAGRATAGLCASRELGPARHAPRAARDVAQAPRVELALRGDTGRQGTAPTSCAY